MNFRICRMEKYQKEKHSRHRRRLENCPGLLAINFIFRMLEFCFMWLQSYVYSVMSSSVAASREVIRHTSTSAKWIIGHDQAIYEWRPKKLEEGKIFWDRNIPAGVTDRQHKSQIRVTMEIMEIESLKPLKKLTDKIIRQQWTLQLISSGRDSARISSLNRYWGGSIW
jgi:hypothetical protein